MNDNDISHLIDHQSKTWAQRKAMKRMDDHVNLGMFILTVIFFITSIALAVGEPLI